MVNILGILKISSSHGFDEFRWNDPFEIYSCYLNHIFYMIFSCANDKLVITQ